MEVNCPKNKGEPKIKWGMTDEKDGCYGCGMNFVPLPYQAINFGLII